MSPEQGSSGFTILELLVSMAVFLIVISAILSVMISGHKVQVVAEEQSARIQETEAVVHLINYEVGLAGYTRTDNPQEFSDTTGPTIRVLLGSGGASDVIRIRFFEDPDFLHPADSGERLVEYSVDASRSVLVRTDLGEDLVEDLVGGVSTLEVVEFIDRNRVVLTAEDLEDEQNPPEIAGVRFRVQFDDNSEWTFLVGLYNRQRVIVDGTFS